MLSYVIENYNASKKDNVPFKVMLGMVLNLLNFVVTCYFDKVEYISECLYLAETLLLNQTTYDIDCTKLIVKILTIPLEKYHYQILVINSYPQIMKTLNFDMSKDVSCKIIKSLIDNQ